MIGGGTVRTVLFLGTAMLPLLLGACGDDKPVVDSTNSEQVLQRDCNDPKWKQQNLGLWYSVCRQPMRW
jgi:hypothetical protein